jgi:tetratricopeptide (TPR) repeat protein
VRALVHDRAAWIFALVGEAKEATAALAAVEEQLHAPTDAPTPGYAEWVDAIELQVIRGRTWTELKRPLRAIGPLEAAIDGLSDRHVRDKALYSSWLAEAYLLAGEIEQAADLISRSLDLVADTTSVRPVQRLVNVGRQLYPYQTVGVVSDLLARDAFDPLGISS